MSKGEGKKIVIDFTLPLEDDVIGNENSFSVTGQEYLYTDGPNHNGPLIDNIYEIDKIQRYLYQILWKVNFDNGILINTVIEDGFLSLEVNS